MGYQILNGWWMDAGTLTSLEAVTDLVNETGANNVNQKNVNIINYEFQRSM